MKRLLILGCCCLAFSLRGQEASSTNAAAPPRPVQRFLFLIDTSSAMSPQKTVTLDTVSRLILSGVGGRIQNGEIWGLWTIDDQLHTDVIPAQKWDPQQRGDLANRIYRSLRDERFNKKKALLEKSLAAVAQEAKLPGTLTVFLFTDGSKPVKGTPFDKIINEIFDKHAAGMRKAKKPFVIVFVAQDGRFVAHAVSPAGERIYIPPLPQAMATAKKPIATENAAPVPPPAKTLTAEEISELLRQTQKRQTNTQATTPAPLVIRGDASQTNPVAPNTSSKAAVDTPVQSQTASVPATNTTASAPTTNTIASVPATIASAFVPATNRTPSPELSVAVAPAPPVRTKRSAPPGKNESATGDAIATSTRPDSRPPVATTERVVDDTSLELAHSSAPAQTAVLAQHEPLPNAPIYLMAAVALLVIALIMGWLYIRSIRYVPRPSLISRSLEKERK